MANTSPILIVGAGTTGLAMACELARHGAPVRIIDKQSGINPHCRACSLHARTLEIFHDFGIVDEILAHGHKVLGMSQYANGERFTHSSGAEIARLHCALWWRFPWRANPAMVQPVAGFRL